MSDPVIRVAICTFRRPDQLGELLTALTRLDPDTPPFNLRVVDNDPAASARTRVSVFARDCPLRVEYVHEPEQNIALARNRAVADLETPWLAFIDDDEVPDPGWLLGLWRTGEETGADAVFGPVIPVWPADAPDWLKQNPVHDRQRFDTGASVPAAQTRTSNVLIRNGALNAVPGPFDPSYGLSGGEDTKLFKTLAARGARFVWCDDAPVSELVPAERLQLLWLLRRFLRGGHNHVRQEIELDGGSSAVWFRLRTLIRSVFLTMAGSALALCWLPFSRAASLNLMCRVAGQVGQIYALSGREIHEYRVDTKA